MKYESENFKCASIKDRVQDLHEAFLDKNVKAIITAIGGYNVNQILDYIDYNLIRNNPKIICEFSDITALLNSMYAKTGMITYLGIQFFSLGMKYGTEYSMEYFLKMCMNDEVNIKSSKEWSNDKWKEIIETKKELKDIPIVIDADFGHTTPIFTFPIGGTAEMNIDNEIKIMNN